VDGAKEATGLGHVVGNKGGQVARFKVGSTSLAFVSSHLAAHEGKKHLEARHDNTREILDGARVGDHSLDVVSQTDHTFWMGDLNYRLDLERVGLVKHKKGATKEEVAFQQHGIVMGMVNEEAWDDLWAADELQNEMKEGKVFFGFEEGLYHFPPTFKVQRDETYKWIENRTPSYCDRILWHSNPNLRSPAQVYFHSIPTVLTSDHKPVQSIFNVTVKPTPKGSTKSRVYQTNQCPNIVFKSLSCEDVESRDLLTESDCFLTFHNAEGREVFETTGKRPPSTTLTSDKTNSKDPKWQENEIPVLKGTLANKAALNKSHLLVCVWDDDGPVEVPPLSLL